MVDHIYFHVEASLERLSDLLKRGKAEIQTVTCWVSLLDSRIGTSENLLLHKCNENTGKNCQINIFRTLEINKGLHQSKEN